MAGVAFDGLDTLDVCGGRLDAEALVALDAL